MRIQWEFKEVAEVVYLACLALTDSSALAEDSSVVAEGNWDTAKIIVQKEILKRHWVHLKELNVLPTTYGLWGKAGIAGLNGSLNKF